MHRCGAADRLRADLREPDVADVSGLRQLCNRADGLLDRDVRVEPCRPVHVDVVDTQPLERVRQRSLHGLRARVVPEPAPVGSALRAELHADHDLVTVPSRERLGDQKLVVAHPIEIAGVEQRDAGVERRVDRRDALGPVGRAVCAGHAHAPQRQARNLRPGGAELSRIRHPGAPYRALAGRRSRGEPGETTSHDEARG